MTSSDYHLTLDAQATAEMDLIRGLLRELDEPTDAMSVYQFRVNHDEEAITLASQGDAGALAKLRHACGLDPLAGITVCPGCGKHNEYADEDGNADGPREYHAECWDDGTGHSEIVFRSDDHMTCVAWCQARRWELGGWDTICHAPTWSVINPGGRRDWIVAITKILI